MLSCVVEECVIIVDVKKVVKKECQVEDVGVIIKEQFIDEFVFEELCKRIDKRIEDWKVGCMGRQVYIIEVRFWVDMEYRCYFWVEIKEGEIVVFCVFYKLLLQNGYQIKFVLDFFDFFNGMIEVFILVLI